MKHFMKYCIPKKFVKFYITSLHCTMVVEMAKISHILHSGRFVVVFVVVVVLVVVAAAAGGAATADC